MAYILKSILNSEELIAKNKVHKSHLLIVTMHFEASANICKCICNDSGLTLLHT